METLENNEELETEVESTEPESVEETARRTYEELKEGKELEEQNEADKNLSGNKGAKAKEADVSAEEKPKPDKKVSKAASTLARSRSGKKRTTYEASDLETEEEPTSQPKYEAPQRFSAQEKEWFNKQDPIVQKNVSEVLRGFESHFTRANQELARDRSEFGEIKKLMDYYTPKWNLQGLDQMGALRELCAIQQRIVEDPIAGFHDAMLRAGVTPEQVYNYRQGRGGNVAPAVQQPQQQQHNFLTPEEFDRRLAEREQKIRFDSELRSAQSEIERLRDERSQAGSYIYPELHDPVRIEGLKPLVDYLRTTTPGASWADLTRKAIMLTRGQSSDGSPSSNGHRLTPQQEIAKVKAASVSVKGRGNGAIPTHSKAQKGESVTETAEKLYDQYFPNN